MHKTVSLNFRPDADLSEAVKLVEATSGVDRAVAIFPDETHSMLGRMYIIHLDDSSDPTSVVESLRSIKSVESAEVTPMRTVRPITGGNR